MFLVKNELKKLMKRAYKGGLVVANKDGRIYMSGWCWEMDIKREHLPKEILAMIIELTGVLPEPGERFSATKDGNQMEIGDMEVKCEEIGAILDESKVLITSECGQILRVFKSIGFGKVVLLPETINQMVEERCIDTEKGEEPPAGPMYVEGKGIYWWNNVMRFKAMYMTADNAEAELVSNLEKISL